MTHGEYLVTPQTITSKLESQHTIVENVKLVGPHYGRNFLILSKNLNYCHYTNCLMLVLFCYDIFLTFQIETRNRNITWLNLTGIQFLNEPWVSGMKISSSHGLKNFQK